MKTMRVPHGQYCEGCDFLKTRRTSGFCTAFSAGLPFDMEGFIKLQVCCDIMKTNKKSAHKSYGD